MDVMKAKDESITNNNSMNLKPFKFRNPETPKRQPPPLQPIIESDIRNAKTLILNEYVNYKKSSHLSNISKDERNALTVTKKRKDLIIKPSDKDKQFVVVPKQTYIEHINDMLSDTETCTHIPHNPLPKMTNDIDSVCNFLANKYPIFTDAQPYLPRLPEFCCT